ncbi:MAG: hypothetical protein DRO05_05550, partial [Thermoproteota archaeon]
MFIQNLSGNPSGELTSLNDFLVQIVSYSKRKSAGKQFLCDSTVYKRLFWSSSTLHEMRLRFLGGAKEVGRSCLLLSTDNTSILLDCGIKSAKPTEYPAFEDLPPVDAVIWSHAHIDHIGATPLLFS